MLNNKIQRLERKIERLKKENKALRKKNLNLTLKRKKDRVTENIDMEMRIIQKVGEATLRLSDKIPSDYYTKLNALNNIVDDDWKNNAVLGDIAVMLIINQYIKEAMTEVLKNVLCEE